MAFPRQEYWSGLPVLPPGDRPNPGIRPRSLRPPPLPGRVFTTSATDKTFKHEEQLEAKSYPSWSTLLRSGDVLLQRQNEVPHPCSATAQFMLWSRELTKTSMWSTDITAALTGSAQQRCSKPASREERLKLRNQQEQKGWQRACVFGMCRKSCRGWKGISEEWRLGNEAGARSTSLGGIWWGKLNMTVYTTARTLPKSADSKLRHLRLQNDSLLNDRLGLLPLQDP